MRRLLLIGAAALVLAALVAVYLLWWGPGPKPGPHTIIVEEGSTLGSVARQLEQAGRDPGQRADLLRDGAAARLAATRSRPASSRSRKGMGGAAILDLLQHGKPVQRLITVTEGMPSIIVEEKLAANPYLTGAGAADRRRARCCPTATAIERGETRAAVRQAGCRRR